MTAALWGALAAAAPAELEVPELTGRAVDRADILSTTAEEALEALLRRLEDTTGAQVAILTIPSLAGEPIESYALRVAEHWALGSRERDDGALLLVAVDDRRVRIEVGYGLEGDLPDAAAARIIREELVPRLSRGDYDGGVLATARSIAERLAPAVAWTLPEAAGGEPQEAARAAASAAPELPQAPPPETNWAHLFSFAFFLLLMPLLGAVYGLFAKTTEARGITFGGLLLPILLGGSLIIDELHLFPPDSSLFLLGGVLAVALFSSLYWGLHLRLRKRPKVQERWRRRLDELADGRFLLRVAGGLGIPVSAQADGTQRWLRWSLWALPFLLLGGSIAWLWHPGFAIFYFHNLFWLFVIYRGTLHPSPSTGRSRSRSRSRRRSPRSSSWSRRRSTGGARSFRGGGGSFGGGGASAKW